MVINMSCIVVLKYMNVKHIIYIVVGIHRYLPIYWGYRHHGSIGRHHEYRGTCEKANITMAWVFK